jgi:hypothetical protein
MCSTAMDPLESKLLLALFGALLSWGVKAMWDEFSVRRRWRRLAPLVVSQVSAAARSLASFDTPALPRVTSRLIAAQGSATELVAAGVMASDWIKGLQYMADCLDAAQAVETAPADTRTRALQDLARCGRELLGWTEGMKSRASGFPAFHWPRDTPAARQ